VDAKPGPVDPHRAKTCSRAGNPSADIATPHRPGPGRTPRRGSGGGGASPGRPPQLVRFHGRRQQPLR
jgi:hypothetical protein